MKNVSRPDEVIALAENLGVDAVIVGTVTRYDPYPPPEMGMALQLYLRDDMRQEKSFNSIDPGELARAPRPVDLPVKPALRPQAMVVRIFDTAQVEVVERIKKYAQNHNTDKTPLKWKKYTTSRNFLRFVCHEMIGELLAQEQQRLNINQQVD